MDGKEGKPADDGTYWIVQQFAVIAGRPWYALQQRRGSEAVKQFTGHWSEIDELCRNLKIVPRELEPVTEEEFYSRWGGR